MKVTFKPNAGRFGNHMFQYAFARSYAERHGAEFICPPWIGQKIFNLADQVDTVSLPEVGNECIPVPPRDVCFAGHCQCQAQVNYMSRVKLKTWFTFQPRWQAKYAHLWNNPPGLALHVRHGDYTQPYPGAFCCMVSERSYLDALVKYGLNRIVPVWVVEGNICHDQELLSERIPFLADFITLCRAGTLLRSNSTFSWWAGTLGEGRVFSPVTTAYGYQRVSFVEGNHPKMLNDEDLHLPA